MVALRSFFLLALVVIRLPLGIVRVNYAITKNVSTIVEPDHAQLLVRVTVKLVVLTAVTTHT